jgi:hypothetical protein
VPELAVTIARDMAIGGTAIALGAGAGAAYAAAGWPMTAPVPSPPAVPSWASSAPA